MAEAGIKHTGNVLAYEGESDVAEIPTMEAGEPSLYDIATQLVALGYEWNEIANNPNIDDNEMLDDIEGRMDMLIVMASKKFDNAVAVIKDMEFRIQMLKSMQDDLQKKRQSATNAMERLKGYLKFIGQGNPQAIKGAVYKGSIYSKASVEDAYDDDLVPAEFIVEKITTRLDKKRILELFKEGTAVPGTTVTEKEHLRIT